VTKPAEALGLEDLIMRTLAVTALIMMPSLLMGCAAIPQIPTTELAAEVVPHHRSENSRTIRYSVHENHKIRQAAPSEGTHEPSTDSVAQSKSSIANDCNAIPVGAERAMCLDRQLPKDVNAIRDATPSRGLRTSDSLGDTMKLEDEQLSKRINGICRGC
jgi:hypothetical protein